MFFHFIVSIHHWAYCIKCPQHTQKVWNSCLPLHYLTFQSNFDFFIILFMCLSLCDFSIPVTNSTPPPQRQHCTSQECLLSPKLTPFLASMCVPLFIVYSQLHSFAIPVSLRYPFNDGTHWINDYANGYLNRKVEIFFVLIKSKLNITSDPTPFIQIPSLFVYHL